MSTSRRSRDAVERHERLARASAARAQRHRGLGVLLISLGVAIWLVPFLVHVVLWVDGVNLGNWPNTVLMSVFPVSLALVVLGRRMRVRAAERAEIAVRWSSRVRISPRGRFEETYEERLAHTLRKIGPVVAVGDPTERLPLLGAARTYAADEDWQETVDELTARAGVVLLQAGEGDGLAWEVHHLIAADAPERAILSLPVPAKRKQPSRQERYDVFRRRFGDDFPRPLPEVIGHCQFAYFDADWTPRLLGDRGAPLPAGESECARALRCLAREFKIAWGPLWARSVVYCAALIAALLGLDALISSSS